jgi:hypothetical protein
MPRIGPLYFAPDDLQLSYRTYSNYIAASLKIIDTEHGDVEAVGLVRNLGKLSEFKSLSRQSKDTTDVRAFLTNAWFTELVLALPLRHVTGDAIRHANIWAPVQAYYALFAAARARFTASGQKQSPHRSLLSSLANLLSSSTWLPAPWSNICTGCTASRTTKVSGLPPSAEIGISGLSAPRTVSKSWGLIELCLRKTREARLNELNSDWKRRHNRKNMFKAEKKDVADKAQPTTIFDFFYRLRIRSNYMDAESFALGPGSADEARSFYENLTYLTSSSLLLVEALIAARIGLRAFIAMVDTFHRNSVLGMAGDIPAVNRWAWVDRSSPSFAQAP